VVRRFATHVLGTSRQVLGEYGFTDDAFPRQVIRTLHCGFDTHPFAAPHADANEALCREVGWPEGSRICLFAGRLDGFDRRNPEWNHKNPGFALDVVHEAIRLGGDVRLLMAGAGDEMRAILEERVTGWGLGDRIRFLGQRRDIPRLMAASHVCLFPSSEEGLGMVAVEAQAAGLRVLASDAVPREAGVIPELIQFLPLAAGAPAWASQLLDVLALPRYDSVRSAQLIEASPFAVAHSYRALREIYLDSRPAHILSRPYATTGVA
jgi:glycosyltransferase involved in cell wall biosynthesis